MMPAGSIGGLRSLISAGALEGGLHLRNRYPARVVSNGIDLFSILEAARDLLHAGQPFQGCFADVISADKKDRLGKRVLFSFQGRIEGQPQETQKNKDRQF
jgi:hypothetical protein